MRFFGKKFFWLSIFVLTLSVLTGGCQKKSLDIANKTTPPSGIKIGNIDVNSDLEFVLALNAQIDSLKTTPPSNFNLSLSAVGSSATGSPVSINCNYTVKS